MTSESLPGRVVVGVGDSLGAYQALRYAAAEARRRCCGLLAVRAFRSPTYGQELLPVDRIAGSARAQVELAFRVALGGVPADLQVEFIVLEGSPAYALVSTACRESDLLVIGGCGARRTAHLRRATIARFCAREAACPVVIVPPTAMARAASATRLARATARDAEEYLTSTTAG